MWWGGGERGGGGPGDNRYLAGIMVVEVGGGEERGVGASGKVFGGN